MSGEESQEPIDCKFWYATDMQLLSNAQYWSNSKKTDITFISVQYRLIQDLGITQTHQNSNWKFQLKVDYKYLGLWSVPSQRLKQACFPDLGSHLWSIYFLFSFFGFVLFCLSLVGWLVGLLFKLFIYRAVRFSFLQHFFNFWGRNLHQVSPCSAKHFSLHKGKVQFRHISTAWEKPYGGETETFCWREQLVLAACHRAVLHGDATGPSTGGGMSETTCPWIHWLFSPGE